MFTNIGGFVLYYILENRIYRILIRERILSANVSFQLMVFRCGQLDSALNEATSRVRALENKNNLLEIEVVSTLLLLSGLMLRM